MTVDTEILTVADYAQAVRELVQEMTMAVEDREAELLEMLESREAEIRKLNQRIAGYKANSVRRRREQATA